MKKKEARMHTIKKKETPLVFYIFFSLEVKLGVILLDWTIDIS